MTADRQNSAATPAADPSGREEAPPAPPAAPAGGRPESGEIGGPAGPEPTRYGDWEVGGRCTDF